jgi:hypothetical protein
MANNDCPNFNLISKPLVCGADWVLVVNTGTYKQITGTTKASPIVVTIPNHGYSNGQTKILSGCQDPAANGTWVITAIDANTFSLGGSVGLYNGGSGGYCITPDNLTGFVPECTFNNILLGSPLADQPSISISTPLTGEITITYTFEQLDNMQSYSPILTSASFDVFVSSGGLRYKKFKGIVPIVPAITIEV